MRQLSTELGLFGDLLDVSGGLMFCWEEGRRAIQRNPDLGISGVDRVGHLFSAFGPAQAWVPHSPGSCLSEEFRQGLPFAVGVAG